jgi:hypothetical protein
MIRICKWCEEKVDDTDSQFIEEFRTQDVVVMNNRAHALDRVKVGPPKKTDPIPSGDEVEEPQLEEVEAKSAE